MTHLVNIPKPKITKAPEIGARIIPPLTLRDKLKLIEWQGRFDTCHQLFDDTRKEIAAKLKRDFGLIQKQDYYQHTLPETPKTLSSVLWNVLKVPYDYYRWYQGDKPAELILSPKMVANNPEQEAANKKLKKIFQFGSLDKHPDKLEGKEKTDDLFTEFEACKNDVLEKGAPPVTPSFIESPWYLHAFAALFALRHAFMTDFVYRGLVGGAEGEKKAQEWQKWAYASPKTQIGRLSFDLFFRYAIPLDLQLTHDMVESGHMHTMIANSSHIRHELMTKRPGHYKGFTTRQSFWSFIKGAVKTGIHRVGAQVLSVSGGLALTTTLFSLPQGLNSYNRHYAVSHNRYQAAKRFLSSFVTSLLPSLSYYAVMFYSGGSVAMALPALILTSNIIGLAQQGSLQALMAKENALTSFNRSMATLEKMGQDITNNPELIHSPMFNQQLDAIVTSQATLLQSVPEVREMAMMLKLLKLLKMFNINGLTAQALPRFKHIIIELGTESKEALDQINSVFKPSFPKFKLADLKTLSITPDRLQAVLIFDQLLASGQALTPQTIQETMKAIQSLNTLSPIEKRFMEFSMTIDGFIETVQIHTPSEDDGEHKENGVDEIQDDGIGLGVGLPPQAAADDMMPLRRRHQATHSPDSDPTIEDEVIVEEGIPLDSPTTTSLAC